MLGSEHSVVSSMDNVLVDVLRSVRVNRSEQAEEVTEVQIILLSNRNKMLVIVVCCSSFVLLYKALPMFVHVDMPNGITEKGR